jgi:prepilin-type N-terminal cleavage/methylation domain-containing protein
MQTTSPAIGSKQPARRGNRRGFTLIELLIVTVIIGMLVAMIAPALMGAFSTARDAGVITEIKQLESAIAAFKATYGVEPPSRITLCESPNAWDANNERKRSKAIIRTIWPQFDFTLARNLNANERADLSITTDPPTLDTDTTDVYDLNAGECLVFFLGGMPTLTEPKPVPSTRFGYTMNGFGKDPTNPFSITGASREGPFFEFDTTRLLSTDGDRFPEYRDGLPGQTTPYLYLSAYEGTGYQALDWSGTSLVNGPYIAKIEDVNLNSTLDAGEDKILSPAATISVLEYHKPKSFQILSPGADSQFGAGGLFDVNRVEQSLKYHIPGTTPRTPVVENDNLTNFHGGRLKR